MPMARNPPIAQEDYGYWNGYAAPKQQWFQHIIHKADHDAPEQKQNCLRGACDCEDVDDGGNQHDSPRLQDRSNQEKQRPQTSSRNSCDQKANTGGDSLDNGNTNDSVYYAAYRSAGEFLEFRPLGSEKAVGK